MALATGTAWAGLCLIHHHYRAWQRVTPPENATDLVPCPRINNTRMMNFKHKQPPANTSQLGKRPSAPEDLAGLSSGSRWRVLPAARPPEECSRSPLSTRAGRWRGGAGRSPSRTSSSRSFRPLIPGGTARRQSAVNNSLCEPCSVAGSLYSETHMIKQSRPDADSRKTETRNAAVNTAACKSARRPGRAPPYPHLPPSLHHPAPFVASPKRQQPSVASSERTDTRDRGRT